MQRTHLVLDGEIFDGEIRGQAKQLEIGQQTLEAGNRLFRRQPGLNPVFEESAFVLTRVDAATTCADLRDPLPPE